MPVGTGIGILRVSAERRGSTGVQRGRMGVKVREGGVIGCGRCAGGRDRAREGGLACEAERVVVRGGVPRQSRKLWLTTVHSGVLSFYITIFRSRRVTWSRVDDVQSARSICRSPRWRGSRSIGHRRIHRPI